MIDIDIDKNVVGFDGDGRLLNCRGEIVPLPDSKKREKMRVIDELKEKINRVRKEVK